VTAKERIMEEEKKVRIKAIVLRKEYYEIELVVPDYYEYIDIENAVREKFGEIHSEISPYDEEEEIWDVEETPIEEVNDGQVA
jgi:hypothetical protein